VIRITEKVSILPIFSSEAFLEAQNISVDVLSDAALKHFSPLAVPVRDASQIKSSYAKLSYITFNHV
jgi:hypothetical protein